MIQLQFKDMSGRVTLVNFFEEGGVREILENSGVTLCTRIYSKGSPIAGMYQRMLHDSRKVGLTEEGHELWQVNGAW